MRRSVLALGISLLALSGTPCRAQLSSAIAPDLFPFPGAHTSPGSGASAALALADRWLGDEPFANPCASRPRTLVLSPALLHVSRQDLRVDNRRFDEQSAFIDAAGGWFGFERGGLGVALYGYQPVVRLEDNAFQRGTGLLSRGSVASNSSAREIRGGLAAALGPKRARFGIAAEWTHRSDHYERADSTGGPDSGTRTADFSGDGFGGQVGFRASWKEGPGAIQVGGALRYGARMDLKGDETIALDTETTTGPISASRSAGWEGGASARVAVTEAFHALAAAGGRSAQRYDGFGVTRGRGAEWKLAGEYHDRRDPWTARFGFGQEHETGVAEPRAGVIGLGAGWQLDTTHLDLGVTHRSFQRNGHPASAEDRVVLSVVQTF